MLKVQDFQMNMFGVNTYVVWDPASREAMVVDPGMISDAEELRVVDFIDREGLTVKYVVNTHLHLDHAFGNGRSERRWNVRAKASEADMPLGRDLPRQAAMFGIPGSFEPVEAVDAIGAGTVLTLSDERMEVIPCPGHSPGGISLYAPSSGLLLCGDTLFAGGGVGRTDLPGSDHGALIATVRHLLSALPADVTVYPGHGPA
ncbi:MAG: MBL fold metallo-hydrolase, partial [Muribaculaceae bacterium]|nr:MBL fold metallo-hydrolase [Muribaculaceae bacterium]